MLCCFSVDMNANLQYQLEHVGGFADSHAPSELCMLQELVKQKSCMYLSEGRGHGSVQNRCSYGTYVHYDEVVRNKRFGIATTSGNRFVPILWNPGMGVIL